ncbi:MAG: pre-peptidase C-terminal domain-containing protein [Chloroflexi bacterium]|nr:pre-peptidase C-terminal domain-containing protein [Chloroflexota bacterium]
MDRMYKVMMVVLLVFGGSLPYRSLETPQSDITTTAQPNSDRKKPADANVLPLVTWDAIDVAVVEGDDVWLALRTDRPIQTTSGIKVDIQLYTAQNPVNPAQINVDFDSEIILPQTNQSHAYAITGYITGTDVLYIKLHTIPDLLAERNEVFYVDVIVSNGTIEPRGNRATVTIVTKKQFYSAFAHLQSCQDVGEPANNNPARSGHLAPSGGVCANDFIGERERSLDYYQISQSQGGSLQLRLKNTTSQWGGIGHHDLDLYLYKFNPRTGLYDEVGRSVNPNQADDSITFSITANTITNDGLYLVGVYWAISTSTSSPSYELTAILR